MKVDNILFDGWSGLFRTLVIGALAYGVLIGFLRASGKRTLSKMNAFDLVVTVALGSTLATILLDRNVGLADGVVALAVLVGLQFIITWSSVRAGWVRRVVTGQPALLLYRGDFVRHALRRDRVTEEELRAAVRAAGFASLADAEAVVLETDGSFSVLPRTHGRPATSLAGVAHAPSATPPDGDS